MMLDPLQHKKMVLERAKSDETLSGSTPDNSVIATEETDLANTSENQDDDTNDEIRPLLSPRAIGLSAEERKKRLLQYRENCRKVMGRFARIDKQELAELTERGKKILAEKRASGEIVIDSTQYTRCISCDARFVCERAFEEATWRHNIAMQAKADGNPKSINIKKWEGFPQENARCMYEVEDRKNKKLELCASYNAFLSANPKDLLTKIREVFVMLEQQTKADPSYAKLAALYYMLINLYKLKFGDKGTINVINVRNESSPTIDVKEMMKALREDTKENDKAKEANNANIVDAEVTDQTDHTEEQDDTPAEEECAEDNAGDVSNTAGKQIGGGVP